MKTRFGFIRTRAGDVWHNHGRNFLLIVGLLALVAVIALYLASCNVPTVPEAPITRAPTLTATITEQPTHIPSRTLTWTPSPTRTAPPPTLTTSPTRAFTPTATDTPSPSVVPTLPTIPAGHSQITPPPNTLPQTGGTFDGTVNHLNAGKGALSVCDEGNPFALISGNTILIGCNRILPAD